MNQRFYDGQHTFAQKYGNYNFKQTEEWLTSMLNVPEWKVEIPRVIGLADEPLDGPWIDDLKDYLATPLGRIVWHMFCIETYNFPLRHDLAFGDIIKDSVVGNINRSGGCVLNNPRISEILLDSKKRKSKKVLLPSGIDASFARLFQYYECHVKKREPFFKLRNRSLRTTKANCSVCGSTFDSKGVVEEGEGPLCLVNPDMPPTPDFDFFEYKADFKAAGGIFYERKDNRL